MIKELESVPPELWRNRAALARLSVEHLEDAEDRKQQLILARLYAMLARYAEERVKGRC